MDWSPQQDTALKKVDQWLRDPDRKQTFGMMGYAGTGKTTLAKYFAESVSGLVLFAAPTKIEIPLTSKFALIDGLLVMSPDEQTREAHRVLLAMDPDERTVALAAATIEGKNVVRQIVHLIALIETMGQFLEENDRVLLADMMVDSAHRLVTRWH